MKICVVLEDHYSEANPSRPAITEIFGNYLPEEGHQIDWIIRKPNSCFRQVDLTGQYKKVKLYFLDLYNGKNFLLRRMSVMRAYFKTFLLVRNLIHKNHYDIIFVRNNVINAILVSILKKRSDFKLAFQYTFLKTSYQQSSESIHPLIIIWKWMENFLIKFVFLESDMIFPISDAMLDMLAESGVERKKMVALPMGVNLDTFSYLKNGYDIKKGMGLSREKIIFYSGSLNRDRHLEIILEAFSDVLRTHHDVRLVLVGDGTGYSRLKQKVMELGIEDEVIFTGNVPYFDVPEYIGMSDICLSPVPPLPVYLLSSPTKLFEYMAMRKPVIANTEIPEHLATINMSKGGLLAEYKPESFARLIVELLENPSLCESLSSNGYSWVKENRSYKQLAELFADTLKNR